MEWAQWLPLADPQKYGGCFGEPALPEARGPQSTPSSLGDSIYSIPRSVKITSDRPFAGSASSRHCVMAEMD